MSTVMMAAVLMATTHPWVVHDLLKPPGEVFRSMVALLKLLTHF